MSEKLLKKGIYNSSGKFRYLSNIFPLYDINSSGIILSDGNYIKIYKRRSSLDLTVPEPEELDKYRTIFENYFSKIKEYGGFVITIKIDDKKYSFDKYLTAKDETNKHFKEFKIAKKEQFEGKKFLDIYIGVSSDNDTSAFRGLMKSLEATPLTMDETVSYIYDLFNPDKRRNDGTKLKSSEIFLQVNTLNTDKPLNLFYKSFFEDRGSYLKIGDVYIKIYRLLTPSPFAKIDSLIKSLATLPVSSYITIKIIKNQRALNALRFKRTLSRSPVMSVISDVNRKIGDNIEKLEKEMLEKHATLCGTTIEVALLSRDIEKLDSIDMNALEFYPETEWKLCQYDLVNNYLSAIPGLNYRLEDKLLFLSTYISDSILMLPSYDNETPTSSLFLNHLNLKVPFEFRSKRRKNNSAAIIAPTGTGKSVLLNYILEMRLQATGGDKLLGLVIDLGGSYENLVKAINKELPPEDRIIYVKPNRNMKYNPFDLDFGREITEDIINEKIPLITNFFSLAFENLTEREEALISAVCKVMYQEVLFGNGKRKSIDNKIVYIDKYIESNYTDIESFLLAMPTINDFSHYMAKTKSITNTFTKDEILHLNSLLSTFLSTPYGKMFDSSSSTLTLGNLVIVDFNDILTETSDKYPLLLLQYLISSRYQYFIRDEFKDYEKMMYIDEYPQFKKLSPNIEKTIDFLLKTGRKKNIDTIVIVQNASTLHPDFLANMGYVIIMNTQQEKEINAFRELFGEGEYFGKTVKKLEFVKNEFTDLLVVETIDNRKQILRFALNDYEKDILTINPKAARISYI